MEISRALSGAFGIASARARDALSRPDRACAIFALVGLFGLIISPLLEFKFLDAIYGIFKFWVLILLIVAAVAFAAMKPKLSSLIETVKNKTIWGVAYFVMFYASLLAGNELPPVAYRYGAAIFTADAYCARVGNPTVISTKNLGTITVFPLAPLGAKEPILVYPRDVMLPLVAWQTRSGDIANKLSESEGKIVYVREIYKRRGRGPLPFIDFTNFPNPYFVEDNSKRCQS